MSILFSLIGIVSLIALWIVLDKSTKTVHALTVKLTAYDNVVRNSTDAIEAALDGDNRMSERRKATIREAIDTLRGVAR